MDSADTLHLHRFGCVDSTNVLALEMGARGAPHRTVILAERQRCGQGQRGRSFSSPAGGLYCSLILRPNLSPGRLPCITLATGLACCQSLERLASVRPGIKWPNDLYLGGRKLAGILSQSHGFPGADDFFVVLGIGININTELTAFPASLRPQVTSLFHITGRCFDLEQVARTVALEVTAVVEKLETRWDSLLAKFAAHDYLAGRTVMYHPVTGPVVQGTGAGLSSDGSYRVRLTDGTTIRVVGGDLVVLNRTDRD
ncbi:biotin--[acetyl-CoA-carboxylase] ligase [Desulfolithobacter dissulfuricans]|uniref:Biotin--[acetyl-CoA-carboxylase] ligase n=1 Tax=Desulfolithobacter dissulfuricans TaxID=2795293 RepID=A0A915XKM8_9BACT|nr:biotin--[acetyl-CoA-carboxylase] ligase [Desulfolithobacter dissulfuricans]BCO10212.1 biotin--[acetyl-CoA-carboxylase] ligase [Desulfolithobacter dissulfuricans]